MKRPQNASASRLPNRVKAAAVARPPFLERSPIVIPAFAAAAQGDTRCTVGSWIDLAGRSSSGCDPPGSIGSISLESCKASATTWSVNGSLGGATTARTSALRVAPRRDGFGASRGVGVDSREATGGDSLGEGDGGGVGLAMPLSGSDGHRGTYNTKGADSATLRTGR